MSIFKETFKTYVKAQIELRQAIIGQDLDGLGRFHAKKLTNKGVKVPTGAFHTYTTSKQSYIRMASCVDIDPSDLGSYEGPPYEDMDSIKGPRLAQRYVLDGGVPFADIGKVGVSRKTFRPREGGVGKKFKDVYGDPYIRSDAKDGFGIVPMPGIKSVETKTETAYGSLRSAKIEWECHNQRQLDILEKLYLRPGYPILMEWGWTPFINNDGELNSHFPLISDGDDFWSADITQEEILLEIINKKKESSGNYDGMFGIIKNFNCAVTDIGGYKCTTEVISQGDVLDSLNGRMDPFPLTPPPEASDKKKVQPTNIKHLLDTLYWYSNEIGDKASLWGQTGDILQDLQPFGESADEEDAKIKIVKDQLKAALGTEERPCTDEELGTFIIADKGPMAMDATVGAGDKKIEITEPYIRWDGFAHLLNKWVIERTNKGSKEDDQSKPIVSIQTNHYVKEDYDFDPANLKSGVGHRIEPITYKSFKNYEGTNDFDFCVDPSAGVLPSQIFAEDDVPLPFQKIYPFYYGFDKKDFLEKTNYKFEEGEIAIGHTYLNINMLYHYYTTLSMRTDDKGFNLGEFLRNIWDGVSSNSGNHKFVLHTDFERPNIIRVIDLNSNTGNDIFDNAFTLNILGTDSICRKSTYNTSIPSSQVATMAINSQDTRNAENVDDVTWNAFNEGIRNRFYKAPIPMDEETKENIKEREEENTPKGAEGQLLDTPKKIYDHNLWLMDHEEGDDEGTWWGFEWETEGYQQQIRDYKKAVADGDYQVAKEGTVSGFFSPEATDEREDIEEMKKVVKKAQAQSEWLCRHNTDGSLIDDGPAPPAVIPLKFQCELDGISGIVVGNVFKIDPSRLPQSYKNKKIAFIVMGESQKITAGQDWTVEITGQMQLFNGENPANYIPPKTTDEAKNKKAKMDGASGKINPNVDDNSTNGAQANRLRKILKELGYKEKGVEIDNGGDISITMRKAGEKVFRTIKKEIPSIEIKVTGGNDAFHQRLGYTSRHTAGRALDFVIYPSTNKNLDKVVNILQRISAGNNPNFRFIDEYRRLSKAGSGAHFHISWGPGTEAQSTLNKSLALAKQGKINPIQIA